MQQKKSYIFPHFPTQKFSQKADFITVLAEPTELERTYWGGYFEQKYLQRMLENFYRDGVAGSYQPPQKSKITEIVETLEKTQLKIHNLLPEPGPRIQIHLYPWKSSPDTAELEGVNGRAQFNSSVMLFIDQNNFSHDALEATLAHEYNHAVRFHHFPSTEEKTLGDSIVLEGLAEHFREAAVGGESAAWSTALSTNQLVEYWKQLEPHMLANILPGSQRYDEIFYGTGELPRWVGYSLGYKIVGDFIAKQEMNWPEIMRQPAKKFLRINEFAQLTEADLEDSADAYHDDA